MAPQSRFCLLVIASIAVALVLATSALAQAPAHRNAASWYTKAIEQYENLPEAQRNLLASWDPSAGPPTPELRAALSSVQSMLQNMQRGSAQEFSDFNLDFSQGIGLMLPHLNRLRNIASIARTDALVRLHDGDTSGAADRIAAVYKMGGHGGDDGTLISSLVGHSVFRTADYSAQFGLDSAMFNAADSAKLLAATKELGADDPFNYVEGLAGEQEFLVDWIANTFTGENAAADFAQQMEAFGGDGQAWMELGGLTQDEFTQALDEHDALLNRVIEIFQMPDTEAAKAEIAKLEGEFERGEVGPLSKVLTPAFGKLYETKLAAEKMLADRIALYEKLATDQAKPQEAANAAIWYLRGIELLEKLDPAKLDVILKAARENIAQPSIELAGALADAQPAIDVFREASLIKRCDFAFARRSPNGSNVIPAYAPGMHDGFLVLHADAMQSLAAGKREAALDRITVSFRASAHLGGDPIIISGLIAHHHFNTTLAMVESAFLQKTLADDDKPTILSAVVRMSRKDPFGYIGAVTEARKAVAALLGGPYTANQDDIDRHAKAEEFVKSLSGDPLLHVLMTYQFLAQASTDAATRPSPLLMDSATRISDILSVESIDMIGTGIPQIAPALAMHDWSVFTEQPARPVLVDGTVSERMRRARGDVRRAMLLLKPFDAQPSGSDNDEVER